MLTSFSNLDLIDLTPLKDSIVNAFTKEDLGKFLKSVATAKSQKSLRDISRHLYYASSHYRSLINYHATLYNFDYLVEGVSDSPTSTINAAKFEKDYYKAIASFEKLNIKYESLKIRAHAYIDGVFYGYVRETKNSSYIQHFDPDNCKISFIDTGNGLHGYSFNFAIFKSDESLLMNYPDEFTLIYMNLKNIKAKNWWAKIESPKAICIKPNVGFIPIPPFVALFESILDIADFKALYKGKEEMGNYQLLYQYIPIRLDKDAEADQFMLSADFVRDYHNEIANSLNKNLGLITSPMKIEPIKFDRDTTDTNRVAEATSQYWNEAGVPELLFGNSTSSTGLKLSIIADEASNVGIVEDIEKWVNEYAKAHKANFASNTKYSFVCSILKTTKFNQQDYIDSLIKMASASMPLKREIMAAAGKSPSSFNMSMFLENDVLKLHEKLIPLQTSYTQPSDAEVGGRPALKSGELSESGEKNIQNDANDPED